MANFTEIKKRILTAVFSDDDFLDRFVLKGGNAIDLVYGISDRASIDLDFSICDDFSAEELPVIENKFKKVLTESFLEIDIMAFDFKLMKKPAKVIGDLKFWGGYCLEFKLVPEDIYNKNQSNISVIRRQSLVIGPHQKKTYKIDISKHEYCEGKVEEEFDDYTIYVYSPEMIVFEKVRALCQQTAPYKKIIGTKTTSARSRDFVDIYNVIEKFNIDPSSDTNIFLLKKIFDVKKVPYNLIASIRDNFELHQQDFQSVKDTISHSDLILESFEFYFEYVLNKFEDIQF